MPSPLRLFIGVRPAAGRRRWALEHHRRRNDQHPACLPAHQPGVAHATGVLVLIDTLALGPGNRGHEIGAAAPHLLLRSAECVTGEIDVDVDYAPRPEYGIGRPLLERDGTMITTCGGPDRLVLTGTRPVDVHGASASARVRLRAGRSLAGALS